MIVSLLKLMRLYYAIPMAGGFLVVVLYRTGGSVGPFVGRITLACVSLVLIIAAGYVLNDACDLPADRINCPNRVLPRETIARKTVIAFAGVLFALGLAAGAICTRAFLGVAVVIAAGLVFYDCFSKKIGFLKDLLVAILMISLYPLAFSLVEPNPGPRAESLAISPFWLFFSTLGYEMLKDVRDHQGDRHAANRGIAAISSQKWFLRLAKFFAGVGAIISLIPFALGQCKTIYLIACLIAILLVSLAVTLKSFRGLPFLYAAISTVTFGALLDLLAYGSLK